MADEEVVVVRLDPSELIGRDAERAELGELVAAARDGRGGAIALVGAAGIGKSALLREVQGMTSGQILRTVGIQRESAIPYAALHGLIAPLLAHLDDLRPAAAATLRRALSPVDSPGGGPSSVGKALLELLAHACADRPVTLLVDDAHWLDAASADALFFAARRLVVVPAAVVVAARAPWPGASWGIPVMHVAPLADDHAAELVARCAPRLSVVDRDAVLGQARGNPLALHELAVTMQRDDLVAARTYLLGQAPAPVRQRVQTLYEPDLDRLSDDARTGLLLAAVVDPEMAGLLVEILRCCGIELPVFSPAERAGLVRLVDGRVVFDNPLVRSAAYQAASAAERSWAHAVVADAMAAVGDEWREVWHRAVGCTTTDDPIAKRLAELAERDRGARGPLACASAYERAAELSSTPSDRAEFRLAAARSALDAGCWSWFRALAAAVDAAHLPPRVRAAAVEMQAALKWQSDHVTAVSRSMEAAIEAAAVRPCVTARLLHQTIAADWSAATGVSVGDARVGALRGVFDADDPRSKAVAGLVGLAGGDVAAGVASLTEVRRWLQVAEDDGSFGRLYWPHVSLLLADPVATHQAIEAAVDTFRSREEWLGLPTLLVTGGLADVWLGRPHAALEAAAEGIAIAIRQEQWLDAAWIRAEVEMLVAALRGDPARCEELLADVQRDGSAVLRDVAACRMGLLALGDADYERAHRHLQPVVTGPRWYALVAMSSMADYIEVAAFSGEVDVAQSVLARLQAWAGAAGQEWLESVAHRCQGLLSDDPEAGAWFEKAWAIAPRDVQPFERARTALLYGSWLRRQRRPTEARRVLHVARDSFGLAGASQWVERAEAELRASGESVRHTKQSAVAAALTSQEQRVVELAAAGLTNREIGARLFLSPRTVGHHLYKAFPKLGIASRGELAHLDRGVLGAEPQLPPR